MIDTHTYTKILYHPYVTEYDEFGFPGSWFIAGNTTIESYLYIRENIEEQQLFLYDSNAQEEGLIYDFSLNTGDTLFYRLPWGIWVETEVSVDTVQLLNGEERKIFYNGFSDYIEGLGGIYFGLQFPLSESLSGGGYEAGCISENGEVLWGAAAGSAYGLYLSESNKLSQEGLRIFPNPASEALMIDMSDIKRIDAIAITDMQGREMMRHSAVRSGAVFDISSLPKGVYILRVTNAEGSPVQKKFIKGE